MRHAVLGAGAVGALMAGALARAGAEVVMLMRQDSISRYKGEVSVRSQVLGDFTVEVPAVAMLDREVDVLWVTPKATQLADALARADRVGDARVIPLMNGIDHLAVLRARYPRVTAGTLRVASERDEGWRITQSSTFFRVDLCGAETVATQLRAAGIDCHVTDDEVTMLWQRLAFLAPLALATTVAAAPLGAVRQDPTYLRVQREVEAVAAAQGAHLDLTALAALRSAAPDTMRSSMQRDVEQERAPEIDAVAGPILRGGAQHGIDTPATQELTERIRTLPSTAKSPATAGEP